MTRGTREEEQIAHLRAQIAEDLVQLRQRWAAQAPWAHHTPDGWTAQAARLRGVPAWALGALAGVLAAAWSVLRRPRKAE